MTQFSLLQTIIWYTSTCCLLPMISLYTFIDLIIKLLFDIWNELKNFQISNNTPRCDKCIIIYTFDSNFFAYFFFVVVVRCHRWFPWISSSSHRTHSEVWTWRIYTNTHTHNTRKILNISKDEQEREYNMWFEINVLKINLINHW